MAKVWFVTGSSRGLGLKIVEFALARGDTVIATARNHHALDSLVATYGESRIMTASLDVLDYKAAVTIVAEAIQKFDRIDVVVNNAGYANVASIEDFEMEDFRQQMEVNYFGVVNVTKAVLPHLRKQGSGHIFQISSLGGRMGTPGLSAYQSAKWAIGGFTTVLSQEVGPIGIKVTALEPGGIRTERAGASMKRHPASEPYKATVGGFAQFLEQYNGTEPTLPEDIAALIQTVYESNDPPVRLLVGSDAVQYAAQVGQVQRDSDEKWKDVSAAASKA